MKKHLIVIVPLLLLIASSLISGILTGWYRMGFYLPVSAVYVHHGAIMTGSFLGTVILIERITGMKAKWLFVFPLINVSSIVFFWLGVTSVGYLTLILGAIGLIVVFIMIIVKHEDLPHRLMLVAAVALCIGNILIFLSNTYSEAILWWMAFLLITIVGERLELTRFLPVSRLKQQFLTVLLGLFILACLIPFHYGGRYLTGISMILIASWLLLYDMVRKSIRHSGIHRYTAVALTCGYVWLGITGLFFLMEKSGAVPYDSLIHTFFLGFVFSMIFAHAPIILPGIFKLSYKLYHPMLYVWVFMLQLTLAVRIIGGLLEWPVWKQLGGFANGIVIILFLGTILWVKNSHRTKLKDG
ncbi:MAG: hypothetical protein RIM99_09955 [Cyclobacteriaceae bacterium]